jgi:hypothetical protein
MVAKSKNLLANLVLWATRAGFLILLVGLALVIYKYLLRETFKGDGFLPGFVLLWLFSSYLVLPRIHRRLSKIYVPDYFIGRVRTGDGMLGDPVNLALNGSRERLVAAMKKAGWVQAEALSFASTLKMVRSTVLRQSYPSAPVSSLFLFGNKQELAFQQEVGGSTSQRHHVRFWPSPEGWWLPGGYRADWLAAATFDTAVGFSLFTGQITHRIAEDTDVERDYVVKSLREAGVTSKIQVVDHFFSGYRSRNGGGDFIETDGAMPFVTVV